MHEPDQGQCHGPSEDVIPLKNRFELSDIGDSHHRQLATRHSGCEGGHEAEHEARKGFAISDPDKQMYRRQH
jgi:hypothetical protein